MEFSKIFGIHHSTAVMVVVDTGDWGAPTPRMTLLSLGTHLAGINVITGLIQILIVLIPQISEIFQNKQHTGDAAA